MNNVTKGTWVYADTFSAIVAIKDNKVMCIADFGKGEIGAEESKANAEYMGMQKEIKLKQK